MRHLVAVVLAFSTLLSADQINLKNGDRVTGKIVKKDGGNLTVKTDLMGEVTIPWESVTSVKSDQPLTVVLPGDKTVQGPIETSASRLEVGTDSAPLAEVGAIRDAAEQARYERFLNPGVSDLWAGYFDIGLSAARGNAKTNTFTTAFIGTRVTNSDKTNVYFNAIRSSATIGGVSANTAQAVRGGWGYNRNLTPRAFLNVFNDYEYDKFQNLDLRFVLGGGAGYAVMRNERGRLDVLGGAAYNRESFGPPAPTPSFTRNNAEAYWGDDFAYKLNSLTSITQSFRMFNNLKHGDRYRVNFDLGAVTNINKWLSWQITVSDRFLNFPAPGRQKNDILYTTGLRFSFAR